MNEIEGDKRRTMVTSGNVRRKEKTRLEETIGNQKNPIYFLI
jgi:hypothetical protein